MKAAIVIVTSLMGYALAAPASAASNAPPARSSRDVVCSRAAGRVFLACLKTPKHDEPSESLRERCYKERDDAKEGCLKVDGQQEVANAVSKKQAECAVSGNRVFAQCMKDKVLQKSKETREDCEKKRKNASEACIKGEELKPGQQETTPDEEAMQDCESESEELKPDQQETTPDEEAMQDCERRHLTRKRRRIETTPDEEATQDCESESEELKPDQQETTPDEEATQGCESESESTD
ncbi:hypothetical protein MY4824_006890 [Beauveria thailandica]